MEEIQELFYLGFFSKLINDTNLKTNNEEIEFILYRSRLTLGQIDFVLNSVKNGTTPIQKGIFLLSNCLKISDITKIPEYLSTNIDKSLKTLSSHYSICISLCYMIAEQYGEALEYLFGVTHQESSSLKISCYLFIDRIDLAEEELNNISNPILKSISNALIGLKKDQNSIKTALFSLLDLSERFDYSPLLANLISLCHFSIGEYEQGNNILLSINEKFSNDQCLMINSIVIGIKNSDLIKIKTDISFLINSNNKYSNNLKVLLEDFNETSKRILNQ